MFKIQISNPIVLTRKIDEDINLEEAIEYIFPMDTEYLIMIWNNIFIPLTYKYDISCMALDFIKILKYLDNPNEDFLEVYWSSNTFSSIWKIQKLHSQIRIDSEWNNVIGGTEDLLNKSKENILLKETIVEEVSKLLIFLKDALKASGLNYDRINGVGLINNYV